MDWTFADIRSKVRNLTGRPTTGQLSATDLDNWINNYYQNIFPIEADVAEFKGFTTASLTDGDGGDYTVPDTVLTISPPVTIEDSDSEINRIDLYTDERRFFDLYPADDHNETSEEEEPTGMLVYGRDIYVRPKPDASYTLKYASTSQYPTALSDDDDTLEDPLWAQAVAYGTAIEILQEGGEDEEADRLKDLYDYYIGLIAAKRVKQFPTGKRALPRI